ncbi:hypothetical protein SADO_07547 [Salinisphaera dokdonensis CL-ES53]|uniref:Lipoprotein n=2 Tax=Salinisphaera TaxID=180541 RepID=A0ABV2AZK9_9GAMM
MGALLLAGCATGPAGTQAQTSASNRVLAAYEVPDLLAQAAPAVSQSLDKNLPDDVADADRQRLRDVVFEAYNPQTLQADVAENLREQASSTGNQQALVVAAEQLDTPLATKMIGLESTTGQANFAQDFKAFVNEPATARRKERLRQIDALAQDMQIIELQTGFNVTLLEAMIRGRNAASAPEYQVDQPRIDQMVSETRNNIEGKLEQRVPLMLLYVYRDVSDAELQSYVQLQDRPELVWTNQALKTAIIDALSSAGERVAENFQKAS